MANDFFNDSGYPATRASGASSAMRAQLAAIAAAFDKMPVLTGNGGKLVGINTGGTALETVTAINNIPIGGTTPAAGAFTTLSSTLAATLASLTVTGAFAANGSITLGNAAADPLSVSSSAVTWSGNPTHSGNHTFSGNLTVGGNTILGDGPTDTLAIRPNAITWSNNPTHSGTHTFSGAVTFSAGLTGALTGNASTATALATPRAINGVNFDGTAPITVTAAAGTLTGTTLASGVTASSLTSLGTLTSLNVSGSVGIGTTTPYAKVSIIGTAGLHVHTADNNAGAYVESLGDAEASLAGGADYNSYSAPNYIYTARSSAASGYRTTGSGHFWWNNTGLVAGNTFNSTVVMSLTSTGLGVGAGVTPGVKLDVGASGDAAATMARFNSGGFATSIAHNASNSRIFGNSASRGLALGTNSTDWVFITTDGRLYGAALHNNAGSVSGTTNQYIASGTYTPTITAVSGVSASTANVCYWMRVGNVVTVGGSVTLTCNSGAAVSVGLSLPIASSLVTFADVGGAAARQGSPSFAGIPISADAANSRASANFTNDTNTAIINYHFSFSYIVK